MYSFSPRLVSSYVNYIANHYRKEDSVIWIKQVRGKSFYNVLLGIKSTLITKFPAMRNSRALNNLLHLEESKRNPEDQVRIDSSNTDSRLTFKEFIWVVMKQILECSSDIQCLEDLDVHWRPQYTKCSLCNLKFDVIGKVRQEKCNKLCHRLWCKIC